jgi:hypothetical protein
MSLVSGDDVIEEDLRMDQDDLYTSEGKGA